MFAVVHLKIDNSVEAVPLSWLSTDKTYCHWPKKIPGNFKTLRTNPDSTPGEDWELFEIILVKCYGKLLLNSFLH